MSSPINPSVRAPATFASPFVLALESAQARLRRAALALALESDAVIDLGPAARSIERALSALFDAEDGRTDPVAATREALAHADEAAAALGPGESLDAGLASAVRALAQAAAVLTEAPARITGSASLPRFVARPILASMEAPQLHAVERASLAPTLRVPAAPLPPPPPPPPLGPEPKTFAELRQTFAALKASAPPAPKLAEPALTALAGAPPAGEPTPPSPGFAAEIPEAIYAIDAMAFARARARDCFEEIAMVGMQRLPLPGEPWRDARVVERRMFAAIDVLAALGPPAIAHLPRLFEDAPVKDPIHAFALAMALGCFAGRDALALASFAVLAGERDERSVEQLGAALKLVPHEALPLELRLLLEAPEPAVRAMAIDVLGHRGLASEAELVAATRDAPRVAARALDYLAEAPGPALSAALETHAEATDPALREAVWAAMAMSGDPRAGGVLHRALEAGGEGCGFAAMLLAVTGDEPDARALLDRLRAAPTPALATAVGWAGHTWSLGALVDLLEPRGGGGAADAAVDEVDEVDEALVAAAGEALVRITGAELLEEVDLPDEPIAVPDPPEPDVGEARKTKLAALVSDPRDLPEEPAKERGLRPSRDPSRWRAYLEGLGPELEAAARLRRGRPYAPSVSLAELDEGTSGPEDRRWLARELSMRTGGFVRFDPHDLVAAQEVSIRAFGALVSRAAVTPGRWSRPTRRR